MTPDDPQLRLQYLRETGQRDEAAKYEQYLRETGQMGDPNAALHAEFKRGDLTKRMANENAVDRAEVPSYGTQVAGGLASFGRDIPGIEAVQAGTRALIRGQPYREARTDIRGAEAAAPTLVRMLNRLAGGSLAALATPGTAAQAGAKLGAASGALQSNPDAGLADRAIAGGVGGLFGAALGKLTDYGGTAVRTLRAKSLGENALGRKAAMAATDAANYGAATAEGAGQAATPTIQAAFEAPDIKPYIEIVKGSRTFSGADDATILREAHKLMSEQAGKAANTMFNANDFKAGTSLAAKDLGAAKAQLRSAGAEIMPSFPTAVAEHAKQAGERDAFRYGADATKRLLAGTGPAAKKLETNSPEAFLAALKKMSPDEAKAATEGILGRAKENIGLDIHPLKGFGTFPSAGAIMKTPRFLQAADEASGNAVPSYFQRALLALAQGATNP